MEVHTMKTVRLEEMNTKSFVESGFTAAIIPIGACESHGDHLPLGTDGLTAHMLAVKAAERVETTFVLPPCFLGMSEHYRHKPIAISLSHDTQIRVLKDKIASLIHWNIRKILILNGHDGNIACAEIAAREMKVLHPDISIGVLDWWVVVPKMLPEDMFEVWGGSGHGGELETSIGLSLFPHLTDLKQARGMVPETNAFVKEIWLFEELTRHGATGAPTRGTKEKGDRTVKVVVDFLVDYLKTFEKHGLRYPATEIV
jgi:creatinine amidohydrolase